jgi:hypothetical protein
VLLSDIASAINVLTSMNGIKVVSTQNMSTCLRIAMPESYPRIRNLPAFVLQEDEPGRVAA